MRPATTADIPHIAELQMRWELEWLGAVEQSPDEVRESIELIDSLSTRTQLVLDGARLIGAGLRWRHDTWLIVDPAIDPAPVYDLLVPWFAAGDPAHIEVLNRDETLRRALEARGWGHHKSAFDLFVPVTPDLVLADPTWPPGIAPRGFAPEDAPAAHHLIYIDAGWADVPGHVYRDFNEWRSIFVEHTIPEQQVLAWRGDRLVGLAMGRIWDDGTGWIAQLATAEGERGKGLGRALLLEAMRRRRDAGATSLGLSVQAANRGALRLYLDTGLQIQREWMQYRPS